MVTKRRKKTEKKKIKHWYSVIAPEAFESKELGEITGADENALINRIIPISLCDITGKFSQANLYTTLKLRVKEVKGNNAYTSLIGHELSPNYIKTLARRRRSLLSSVIDITTKDDKKVRLKIVAITREKISQTMKKNVKTALLEELMSAIKEIDYKTLMDDIIYGKMATKLFNRLKTVTPMKRVEFKKTELFEEFI